jgi:hypothetical protein
MGKAIEYFFSELKKYFRFMKPIKHANKVEDKKAK